MAARALLFVVISMLGTTSGFGQPFRVSGRIYKVQLQPLVPHSLQAHDLTSFRLKLVLTVENPSTEPLILPTVLVIARSKIANSLEKLKTTCYGIHIWGGGWGGGATGLPDYPKPPDQIYPIIRQGEKREIPLDVYASMSGPPIPGTYFLQVVAFDSLIDSSSSFEYFSSKWKQYGTLCSTIESPPVPFEIEAPK